MGSHLGETGMLSWEGAVAVDGVHGAGQGLHWGKTRRPQGRMQEELV